MAISGSCKDCGAYFELEPGEISFFTANGLDLPKRCASCRAERQGIHDQALVCARCGRTFLYPRQLQLYARSYKWLPPTTCFGGCGPTKFGQGYQLSGLEQAFLGILGTMEKLVASAMPRALRPAHFEGFSLLPGLTDSGVQAWVQRVFPEADVKGIGFIRYTGERRTLSHRDGRPPAVARGRYGLDRNSRPYILINYQGEQNPARSVEEVLAHEIGHHVYFTQLDDHHRAEWEAITREHPPFLYTQARWLRDEEVASEEFAECYRYYRLDLLTLARANDTKFHWLEENLAHP